MRYKIICQYVSDFENNDIHISSLIYQFTTQLDSKFSKFTYLLSRIINRINAKCTCNSIRTELIMLFPKFITRFGTLYIMQFLYNEKKLNNILIMWCDHHNNIMSPYDQKLSIISLAKLVYNRFIVDNDITFNGYLNMKSNTQIRTRSYSNTKYVQMSFSSKLCQLIIETYKDLVLLHNDTEEHRSSEIFKQILELNFANWSKKFCKIILKNSNVVLSNLTPANQNILKFNLLT